MFCGGMQSKDRLQEISRRRLQVRQLLHDLEKTLDDVIAQGPLIKGQVYEMARRCGAANCTCTRGRLHRGWALKWSEGGQNRLRMVAPGRLDELRQKTARYRRLRQARSRVTKQYKQMVALIDQIEPLRREDF